MAPPPLNGLAGGLQQTTSPYPQGTILDHTGRPWRDEYLDQFALPHVLTFGGLLGQAWRAYWHGKFDEAAKHGRTDALAMEHDCGLQGMLQERKLAVASLPWHLSVPDEHDPVQVGVRDALTNALQSIRGFEQMLMCLLDAIWYGRHAAQVRWKWTFVDGVRVLTVRQWRPVRGDKIGHLWDGTPYVLVLPTAADQIPGAEVINTTAGGRGLVLRGAWRERFILHRHEPVDADFLEIQASEAIHGVGVRSRVFWLDWLKREWLSNIAAYMERVGLGVELWYYDPSNAKSKTETFEAARKQEGTRTRLLVPRWGGDRQPGYERVEVPMSGADFLMRMVMHIEELQERYIVGQHLSSNARASGGMGNEAAAEFQADTKEQIRNFDAKNVAEQALTGDEDEPGLVSLMQRWSFPQTVPSEENPRGFRVQFKFSLEQLQSAEKLNAISVLVGHGLPVKVEEAYSAAGLTRPHPDDDVLQIALEPEGGGPARKRRRGRPERYDAGRWITIGAHEDEDGKKRGGSPVFIQGGRITKGAPGLVGKKLGTQTEKGRKRAAWDREAKAAGVRPEHLHQLAGEMLAHDRQAKADTTRMLQEVRQRHPHVKSISARQARGIDADAVKGLDDIAQSFSGRSEYRHLFAGHEGAEEERLFDLLTAGNPQAMSEEDAYREALDRLYQHGRPAAVTHDDDDDVVPFRRRGRPARYAEPTPWHEAAEPVWHEKPGYLGFVHPRTGANIYPGHPEYLDALRAHVPSAAHKVVHRTEKTPYLSNSHMLVTSALAHHFGTHHEERRGTAADLVMAESAHVDRADRADKAGDKKQAVRHVEDWLHEMLDRADPGRLTERPDWLPEQGLPPELYRRRGLPARYAGGGESPELEPHEHAFLSKHWPSVYGTVNDRLIDHGHMTPLHRDFPSVDRDWNTVGPIGVVHGALMEDVAREWHRRGLHLKPRQAAMGPHDPDLKRVAREVVDRHFPRGADTHQAAGNYLSVTGRMKAPEVDWRPGEMTPEDFHTARRRGLPRRYAPTPFAGPAGAAPYAQTPGAKGAATAAPTGDPETMPSASPVLAPKHVRAAAPYTDTARRRRVIAGVKREGELAAAVGGVHLPDSEPADVVYAEDALGKRVTDHGQLKDLMRHRELAVRTHRSPRSSDEQRQAAGRVLGQPLHFFEVKTLLTSPVGAVHMTAKARARKERWQDRYGASFHVVAVDDRRGAKHSGHRVHVSPGELAGTHRLEHMQKAADMAGVLGMVHKPQSEGE